MKYNKGEWSEVYAFIKLLGDGKIYAADKSMNKKVDEYYPILKMIRDEIRRAYIIKQDKNLVQIINLDGDIVEELDTKDFIKIADDTLRKIKTEKTQHLKLQD